MTVSQYSGVSSGVPAINVSSVAVGSVYTLTNAAAAAVFGTTSPSITLPTPGTYLISVRAQTRLVGATFAANRTVTLSLRRTNNTAANLTGGTITGTSSILTLITGTLTDHCWQAVYTTSNNDDVITIFASIDVVPSAGSIVLAEASITAVGL